ncbi:MAG TPA: hypothetical protein VGF10_10045 [Gaiella sp.]
MHRETVDERVEALRLVRDVDVRSRLSLVAQGFERGAAERAHLRMRPITKRPQARIDAGAGGERQPDLEDGPGPGVEDEQRAQLPFDGLADITGPVDGCDSLRDLLDHQLHGEREEFRLARKDVAERAGRDPGLGRNLADGRRSDPLA